MRVLCDWSPKHFLAPFTASAPVEFPRKALGGVFRLNVSYAGFPGDEDGETVHMAIEDLVDDFWREALISNLNGPQAQAKWNAFMLELQDRVTRFPQEAQDEVFRRAANRNSECILIARFSIDILKKKLGLSD